AGGGDAGGVGDEAVVATRRDGARQAGEERMPVQLDLRGFRENRVLQDQEERPD
ncbi:MAG: hypothetical protein UY76_C0037G0001, partial [Candidatus Uhrbacteria bacterium GW2011_GWA2_52_8d]